MALPDTPPAASLSELRRCAGAILLLQYLVGELGRNVAYYIENYGATSTPEHMAEWINGTADQIAETLPKTRIT